MIEFFKKYPEFDGAYPLPYYDKNERTCRSIDRLADRLWSLERTILKQFGRHENSKYEPVDETNVGKEVVTYKELIEMYDFRGVKSAKDPKWRKANGFDMCVSQSWKGCAVTFIVAKVDEWLSNKRGSLKKKAKNRC